MAIKTKKTNFKFLKMKKLSKLNINPEKVMKNEELINLRGGTWDPAQWMQCTCIGGANPPYASPWEKCYNDELILASDVSTRCVSGANCVNLHMWCNVGDY